MRLKERSHRRCLSVKVNWTIKGLDSLGSEFNCVRYCVLNNYGKPITKLRLNVGNDYQYYDLNGDALM